MSMKTLLLIILTTTFSFAQINYLTSGIIALAMMKKRINVTTTNFQDCEVTRFKTSIFQSQRRSIINTQHILDSCQVLLTDENYIEKLPKIDNLLQKIPTEKARYFLDEQACYNRIIEKRINKKLELIALLNKKRQDSIATVTKNQEIIRYKMQLDSLCKGNLSNSHKTIVLSKLSLWFIDNDHVPFYLSIDKTKKASFTFDHTSTVYYLKDSLNFKYVFSGKCGFVEEKNIVRYDYQRTYLQRQYIEKQAKQGAIINKERVYYTGSEGGCYYINSRKRKVYVDHSFCY